MATTYNYDWSGWPKFRLVVNSVKITNRTAKTATVNYDLTLTINGWYYYDLSFTVKCGNGSKTHKLNPWGTKNDNSNKYRDTRNIKGSFNISNLSQSSSNPGVAFIFKSKQNSHGNVTFGSTSNNSKSSVKVPAYTGPTTNSSTNAGSGNNNKPTPAPSKPSGNTNSNRPSGNTSVTTLPVTPSYINYKDGYTDFFESSGVNDQTTQWLYNTFKVPNSLSDLFKKMDSEEYIKNSLTSNKEVNPLSNQKAVNNTLVYNEGSNFEIVETQLKNCGILGIPFQFNSYADYRSGKDFGFNYIGRTYSKFIWNNMPLVYFEIGKPLYFDSLTSNSKSSIATYITGLFGTSDESELSDEYQKSKDYILGLGGVSKSRYYTFMDDFYEYTKYANTMIRFVSLMMGLGDEICFMTGKKYRKFDVFDLRDDKFFEKIVTGNYLTFYYNPEQSSISESGANSVGESVMSTMFSNVNAMSREIQYLFGTEFVSNITGMSENMSSIAKAISDLTGGMNIEGSGLYQRICSIGACISGANILFPHIWQDSQFSKTYTLNFKFSTPYGDPESVLMNVYIPYLCLLALTLPRQASSQGYKSPFIVKVSSKGYFNCDMGMVESIDIKRGGPNNDQWTVDGLPTEMEINMTIRDLYPTIMATAGSASSIFLANNSSFTEYLSMLSGIDLHVVTPMDRSYALLQMFTDEIIELPSNIAKHFISGVQSKLKWWTRKFVD